jgi:thioredoxin reductase
MYEVIVVADGRAELAAYPTVEFRQGRVVSAEGGSGHFTMTLDDGDRVAASRLLLASGLTDEPADVPGLAERWGASVFHCPFCHGYETNGKVLAVIGNGPDAMLAAYVADRYSDDVVLCTNGPSVMPEPVAAVVKAGGIRVIETPLAGIEGAPPARSAARPRSASRPTASGRCGWAAGTWRAPPTSRPHSPGRRTPCGWT